MITANADTGRRGEDAAAEYLRAEGFELCERNWRSGRYEIDIVARRGDELHFVEVKCRRCGSLTSPEQAITPAKARAVMRAAAAYIAWSRCDLDPRFDLVAVDMAADGVAEVRFILDALECHW